MALGPLFTTGNSFPTANNFSWVGIGFKIGNRRYKKPNPIKFSANTPIINYHYVPKYKDPLDSTGCLRRIWLGWVSCIGLFPIQNQSQPTKKYLLWKQVAQNACLNPIFLGLGWPWVGEFAGFIIISICFPTQHKFGKSRTPY